MPLTKTLRRGWIMSLTTMTFNSERVTDKTIGKIKVLKTDEFFGTDECCIIGKLMEGAVTQEMSISGTDKKIISVESHYGDVCCTKNGAQVVLMVAGAKKGDYEYGQEIVFEKMFTEQVVAKPKGRVIIA
jgi:hypothetical protein